MNDTSSARRNDDAILRQISKGDVDALTEWFHRHKDALYAFIFYRVGGDPELAADAVQSTFAAALERLDRYDPERGDMITWLRFLSRNIVRSQMAGHRRDVQLQTVWDRIDESLQAAYQRIESDLLPEDILQRKETRELVQMTLANLPPQYQQVLEAKYIENHPLETIAKIRDTSLDSVKSMLRRARAAFRECFLAIAKMEIPDV